METRRSIPGLLNRAGRVTASLFARPVRVEPPPDTRTIFFVRGFPRSGTNWVGALLNLHPAIHCHGEFHLEVLLDALAVLTGPPWHVAHHQPMRSLVEERVRELSEACIRLSATQRAPGATIIGDRTPRELSPLVPGSRSILVMRDGRDVLVSWTFHQLNVDGAMIQPFLGSMGEDAAAYRSDRGYFAARPERLLACEGWVRHAAGRWGQRALRDLATVRRIESGEEPGAVAVVRFESLHADVERQRRRLYEFLGASASAAGPVAGETRTAAGFAEERPGEFFRAGRVGDWGRYFTPEVARWFVEEAGEALVAWGYEPSNEWAGRVVGPGR